MTPVRISDAIRDVAFAPRLELSEALDRYYAPDLVHHSDGRTRDRAEFAQMVAGIRDRVAEGEVTVLDELYDGAHYAERHRYRMTLTDGTVVHREMYYFATLAEDGRFQRVYETGFDVVD
ncbi:nuclear transport factor 2 family protein [Micromonospora sp. NPDC049559]|uniref:nuclear transport factor 2 family protein n=1 Tax=Micromonospora sp. NPDC049559 TaxID=3155923 RepID=UPI00341FE9E2